MLVVNKSLNTSGNGFWSSAVKSVKIIGLDLTYVNDEGDFGELQVYFDTTSWDVSKDGLIYTDKQFIKELKELLASQNLGTDVSYSEQGMQGSTYVSLDCESKFIKSFQNLITVEL
jgi:hypothetical protein